MVFCADKSRLRAAQLGWLAVKGREVADDVQCYPRTLSVAGPFAKLLRQPLPSGATNVKLCVELQATTPAVNGWLSGGEHAMTFPYRWSVSG